MNGAAAPQMETAMNLTFLGRFFRARQIYWRTIRELSSYSDRELHDLGIDRADIQQIAFEASRA